MRVYGSNYASSHSSSSVASRRFLPRQTCLFPFDCSSSASTFGGPSRDNWPNCSRLAHPPRLFVHLRLHGTFSRIETFSVTPNGFVPVRLHLVCFNFSGMAIARHLAELLQTRSPPKTFCPSEVVRRLSSTELQALGYVHWKEAMPAVRDLTWGMRRRGQVEVLQKGAALPADVQLDQVRGPIRVRRRSDGGE